MHRLAFTALMMLCFTLSLAQETELEKRNGFKSLKLTSTVDSLKGAKFKKDILEADEFEAKLYAVENPEYERIGEVQVRKVEVKAYKGQVYEILVVADKDPRLMKALESIYGQAEYDLKNETYFWKGTTVTLKFRSHSKNSLELVYNSILVRRMMKEDKQKKVEAIADDF